MSYLPVDQQNTQAPTGQTTPNPAGNMPPQAAGGSVGAGTGGGTAKPGTSPNVGTSTQFGSSASKLGDYLSANAPQITQQANNIAGGLNSQYQGINQDIGNAANNFNQSVQGGYTAPNSTLVDQAAANPTSFVSNPSNVSGFQSQYNDQYTGPSSYESTTPYSTIQNEVSTAVQNAGLLNTPTGLTNYLQGQEKNPTQAQATLDQLLINGNPQAQQQVNTAANQFQQLTPAFQNTVTAGDQNVTAAQQAAQQANQYAHNTLNNTATGFNTGLTNQTATGQAANTKAQQAAIQQQSAANQAIMDAVNKFQSGLTEGSGANYNPNGMFVNGAFNNIGEAAQGPGLTINGAAPTEAQLANPGQYQEASALQQLLGGDYTNPLPGTAPAAYNPYLTDPSIATQNAPLVNPLESFIGQYLSAAQDHENGQPGTGGQFGQAGSPTEANLGGGQYVNTQYQNLLSQLAPYLAQTPGQPTAPETASANPLFNKVS